MYDVMPSLMLLAAFAAATVLAAVVIIGIMERNAGRPFFGWLTDDRSKH